MGNFTGPAGFPLVGWDDVHLLIFLVTVIAATVWLGRRFRNQERLSK